MSRFYVLTSDHAGLLKGTPVEAARGAAPAGCIQVRAIEGGAFIYKVIPSKLLLTIARPQAWLPDETDEAPDAEPYRLTDAEMKVLDLLAEAWNVYLELPVQHPMHRQEFCHAVHDAQRFILARPTARVYSFVHGLGGKAPEPMWYPEDMLGDTHSGRT